MSDEFIFHSKDLAHSLQQVESQPTHVCHKGANISKPVKKPEHEVIVSLPPKLLASHHALLPHGKWDSSAPLPGTERATLQRNVILEAFSRCSSGNSFRKECSPKLGHHFLLTVSTYYRATLCWAGKGRLCRGDRRAARPLQYKPFGYVCPAFILEHRTRRRFSPSISPWGSPYCYHEPACLQPASSHTARGQMSTDFQAKGSCRGRFLPWTGRNGHDLPFVPRATIKPWSWGLSGTGLCLQSNLMF